MRWCELFKINSFVFDILPKEGRNGPFYHLDPWRRERKFCRSTVCSIQYSVKGIREGMWNENNLLWDIIEFVCSNYDTAFSAV